MINESEQPQRVLLVLAHPDDPEFFCGATLAKWAKEGKEIHYLLLTCGDKGSDDPAMTPEMLCADRQTEQRAAADVVGAREIKFLSYPDGELFNTLDVRREIVREIRRFRPHIVVTCDPTTYIRQNAAINHPDHRAAATAATYAVFPSAGSRLIFADLLEAGFEPHNVKRLYVHGSEKPDTWVDIGQTISLKIEALRKHASLEPVAAIVHADANFGRPCQRVNCRVHLDHRHPPGVRVHRELDVGPAGGHADLFNGGLSLRKYGRPGCDFWQHA